jgi:hypothetical protein
VAHSPSIISKSPTIQIKSPCAHLTPPDVAISPYTNIYTHHAKTTTLSTQLISKSISIKTLLIKKNKKNINQNLQNYHH